MTRFGISTLRARVRAAVDAEGIRPFARRAGVGVGVVRSILDDRDPSYSSAEALAKALDLDLGFGAITQLPSPPEPDGDLFAKVPLHSALLAAGGGRSNQSEEVVEYLAFRRDWLRRLGVSPSYAVLARASGDSMQPCLWDGDMVLIDKSQTEISVRPASAKRGRSPIYALLDDGEARIKRIDRPGDGHIILTSDNPDYPPEFVSIENLIIIGKVLWWGHTNRD